MSLGMFELMSIAAIVILGIMNLFGKRYEPRDVKGTVVDRIKRIDCFGEVEYKTVVHLEDDTIDTRTDALTFYKHKIGDSITLRK